MFEGSLTLMLPCADQILLISRKECRSNLSKVRIEGQSGLQVPTNNGINSPKLLESLNCAGYEKPLLALNPVIPQNILPGSGAN